MKIYLKPVLDKLSLVQKSEVASMPSMEDYLNVNGRQETDIKGSTAESYSFAS